MKNKITTTDIYFCAALLATGSKLDSVDKTDPRHMQFSLSKENITYTFKSENLPNTEDVVAVGGSYPMDFEWYENEWGNGTLMINALHFKDAIQRMKSLIHSK